METLYFKPSISEQPILYIDANEVTTVIELVQLMLKMELFSDIAELTERDKDNLIWLFEALENENKRNWIWSQRTLTVWSNQGSSRDWIGWLRNEFNSWEKESNELLHNELTRSLSEAESQDIKYKYKIRIFTNSHSIRQKHLNWFNELSHFTKMNLAGSKKNELSIELSLPKRITPSHFWGLR